jgi:putative oxidoreductase
LGGVMEMIFTPDWLLFAVAITAFGIEHLLRARFGKAVAFMIPWVPGNPFFAYLTGIALLAAGLSIAANIRVRLTAILLGIPFLLCVLLLWVPKVDAHPFGVSIRTCAFETLAMCGSVLTLAACLPPGRRNAEGWGGALTN